MNNKPLHKLGLLLGLGLFAGSAMADTLTDTTHVRLDVRAFCIFQAPDRVEANMLPGAMSINGNFQLMVNCNDQLPYFINTVNSSGGVIWLQNGPESIHATVSLDHPVAGRQLVGEASNNAYTDYGNGRWQPITGVIRFNPQSAPNANIGRMPAPGTYNGNVSWELTL